MERVLATLRARCRGLADPILRERLADIEHLAGRLLDALAGAADRPSPPEGFVLIAPCLGPGELLDDRRLGVAGLVITEASPSAHATMITRALGFPLFAGGRGVWDVAQPGKAAFLDADRGYRRLGARDDVLSTRRLDLVEEAARAADAARVPRSLCGEAAGRPLQALAVFGVGIRPVSVSASAVPAVRAMVHSLDLAARREVLAGLWRSARGGASLRADLAAKARDRGIVVDGTARLQRKEGQAAVFLPLAQREQSALERSMAGAAATTDGTHRGLSGCIRAGT